MKILQLCYEYPPVGGGGGRVVRGLSRVLAEMGHTVHVVTMPFRGEPRREEQAGVVVHRPRGIRLRRHRCSLGEALTYAVGVRPFLRSLAAREGFDLVHAHFILPDGLNAHHLHQGQDVPYLVTAHGSDVPGYNPDQLHLAHRLARPFWRAAAGDASVILCPSRVIERLVLRAGPDLSTEIVPNGHAVRQFRTDRPRKPRILAAGRLVRRKGYHHLIRAVDGLGGGYELHIAGDGPERRRLEALARQVSTPVVFHGWLDNPSPELTTLFETSEIFVLPSSRENFPVSLMEAMSAGLAVVTSRDTGCAEVVGDAGLLVDAESHHELADVLRGLVGDEVGRRRLGRAAHRRVLHELSWERIGRRHVELYESILDDPVLSASSWGMR